MASLWQVHPVGFTNPSIMRVAAALPAAGAWDVAPIEISCAGAQGMTLSFTYTRGAVGGAFDFWLQPSIYAIAANVPAGAGEWSIQSLYAAGAVATGADSASDVQRESVTYGATGAAAETFIYGPIELECKIERIRIPARESGAAGTPGTLQVTAEFW